MKDESESHTKKKEKNSNINFAKTCSEQWRHQGKNDLTILY